MYKAVHCVFFVPFAEILHRVGVVPFYSKRIVAAGLIREMIYVGAITIKRKSTMHPEFRSKKMRQSASTGTAEI